MSIDSGGKPDKHVSNTGAIQETLGGVCVSSMGFGGVLKEAPLFGFVIPECVRLCFLKQWTWCSYF